MYITAKDKDEYDYLVEKRNQFIGEMYFVDDIFDKVKPDGSYVLNLGSKRIDRIADAMYRYRTKYRKNKERTQ